MATTAQWRVPEGMDEVREGRSTLLKGGGKLLLGAPACVITLITLISALAHAAEPIVFFSDIDSGPAGAYVTIWGEDLGAQKGVVSIGGTPVRNQDIRSWTDAKIEFRIPMDHGIGIAIRRRDGRSSNVLPFTVRSGRIFFVSKATGSNEYDGLAEAPTGRGTGPWRDLSPVMNKITSGDIVYVRSGTYTELLSTTDDANFYVEPGHGGATGKPKALVAYPGESPVIGDGTRRRAIYVREGTTDITFAKLTLKAAGAAIDTERGGARQRVIANTASRIPSPYGTFGFSACTDCKVLGNHIYDSGTPDNKLAHLIYYGGYGIGANIEIAWNLLHDEIGGRCIQIYGHTPEDKLSGLSIHDNIVYNCPYDGILIGSSDASDNRAWISDAIVYGNVVLNSGHAGIRIQSPGASVKVLQNTLVNNDTSILLEEVKNASVHNNVSSQPRTSHVTIEQGGVLKLSHNGYHGDFQPPEQDRKPFVGDPRFRDPRSRDFSLGPASSFLSKGIPNTAIGGIPIYTPDSRSTNLGAHEERLLNESAFDL